MLQQGHGTIPDSVVVESPLPGGIAEVVRFLLNTVPAWVQIAGVFVAAAVAVLALGLLVRRRHAIHGWLSSRTRAVQTVLAAAAILLIVGTVGAGAATWNYTQHENAFCSGCHIMNPAFQKFADVENKHGTLSCHACHQQSIYDSAWQLYLWVAERPEKIGGHAKVPNKVCETCHVTGDTATWQRIAATAGHRVHLESDSAALRNLQCVTCHGVEIHRFRPVSETCGQSGCHKTGDTDIKIGKMAEQTVRHCTSCHAFTADVPALATRDSARSTLVPGRPQCLGCHEMRTVLADFDEGKDPHGGKCGMCHNPHIQKSAAAATSCATAGCHANWRDEPFHVGASHRSIASKCLTCHLPHRARVDASNCEGCHMSVRARGKLRPPIPFDTARALRRADATTAPLQPEAPYPGPRHSVMTGAGRGGPRAPDAGEEPAPFEPPGTAPAADSSAGRLSRAPPAPAEVFPHARHARLACLVCHETGTGRGRLTFERPRGCTICHHQAPRSARCASCHRTAEFGAATQATVTVTVPGHPPAPRPVEFRHASHATRTCVECHTTPVTLAPAPAMAQCRDCHSDHHAAERTCTTCHAIDEPARGHRTLEAAHQGCDACHTATTIARLTPTRSLCSTCHTARATNHFDQQECSVCHFLAEPAVLRAKLITRPPR